MGRHTENGGMSVTMGKRYAGEWQVPQIWYAVSTKAIPLTATKAERFTAVGPCVSHYTTNLVHCQEKLFSLATVVRFPCTCSPSGDMGWIVGGCLAWLEYTTN